MSNTPQQGQPVTEEDKFYIQWGLETIKNNITLCNDILKQIITISSALLGVSIIFEKVAENTTVKIAALLSFFFSLLIAFLGVLPFEGRGNRNSPSEIKSHKQNVLKSKRGYLWCSAVLLLLGFLVVVGNLIWKVAFHETF